MLDRFTGYKRLLALAALNGGGASIIERTATGNPLTFITDKAKPLKSLLIPFTPQQEGSGDPSPSNIRPILPWDGLTVFGGGKNLLNLNRTEGTPNPTTTLVSPRVMDTDHFYIGLHDANYYVKAYASGSVQDGVVKVTSINNNSYGLGFPVAVKGGSKYTFNCTAEKVLIGIGYYDAEWNFISSGGDIYKSQIPATRTTPENASYMIIIFRSSVGEEYTYSDIQLEAGQTATAYEPYKPITETDIVFLSAVYGGTLDVVSGVLTVEWASYTFNGSEFMSLGSRSESGIRINSNAIDYLKPTYNMAISDIAIKYQTVPTVIESLGFRISSGASLFAFFVPHSMFDGEATIEKFKEWLASHNMTICTKLDTPQTVTLTPAQITALIGNNTIWSDADGSMTAVYLLTESFGDEHPISGGLGSGLLGGGFGSGSGEPDEPGEPDQPDAPAEPDQPGEE